MAAKGEYKLVRQIQGRGAFAHVSVLVDPAVASAADVSVADSMDSFPDWINAATGACTRILEVLRTQGIADRTTRIVVTDLVGTYVDTSADAIEAASVLAVANAFGLLDEMVLQYDQRWHVDWSSKNVRAV